MPTYVSKYADLSAYFAAIVEVFGLLHMLHIQA